MSVDPALLDLAHKIVRRSTVRRWFFFNGICIAFHRGSL